MNIQQQIEQLVDQEKQKGFEQGIREALIYFHRVANWTEYIDHYKNPDEQMKKVLEWIKKEKEMIDQIYPFAKGIHD